ncbi:uncharacterized protein BO95DRAFT_434289 [Aspergillus brunneoviolaceus CBS 621.78]|uniref:Uncharacterized protein n=1 Tax=Aspergillus brunneoviolaceus CBS 621.78 TaxID=1450534 RepID=A0ACD1G1D0_9EURO|nr:hypothetical protein BO95DRAFT_434289 [Aspergillus brunneoviolaceus CBS 621.78]RAH43044.1 hypothetical protein BO95DRAFT_434289 [Aspergillus brunneoviolaceus CBS 621.78]
MARYEDGYDPHYGTRNPRIPSSMTMGVDHDELDWALDEKMTSDEEDEEGSNNNNNTHGNPTARAATTTRKKLPFPVILPQRRPRTKTRGFVRAYAPVLQDAGVDQTTFLRFLKDLHTHAQASPVLEVLGIAAGVAGIYPDLLVAGVAQAVQIAAMAGREMQERWRTNRFLDQMNRELFMPRGLYVSIVQYESTSRENTEVGTKTVDLGAQAVTKYGGSSGSSAEGKGEEGWKEKATKRLRETSGTTRGEAEMPFMCAPLVFPEIERVAREMIDEYAQGRESASNAALRFKDKAKGTGKWLADYFDRRAQADFVISSEAAVALAFDNPHSTLVKAMGDAVPQFKSKLSDPNDQRNKHLATLITGGKLRAEPLGAKRRWEKAQCKLDEQRARGLRGKPQKRLLQENVLYLMVVNMPTEAELERAKQDLQAAAVLKERL